MDFFSIQDYFEYILKKDGESTDKPSVQIYVNKIENRVTFKIKNGYSNNGYQQDPRVQINGFE